MDLKNLKFSYKKYITRIFDKENLEFKKIVCLSAFIFSSILALIGFFSLTNSFFIGDSNLRILLFILGFNYTILIYLSFFKLNQKRKAIGILIFTIIIFLAAYILPSLAPNYELRDYEIDATIMKFIINSIFMIIIGIVGASLAMKPLYNFTSRSDEMAAYFILIVSILLVIYPLIIIISNIISSGISGFTWEFLTEDVRKLGTKGGVYPALVGTIILMIGTALVALPLGVGCAIYLQEYAKKGIFTRIISICVDILQGTPSIVHGLFGFAFFVPIFGVCLLSGVLTLGFLTLPIIIRSSEEALRSIPHSIREGAYAVGATKWQTIRSVVLPPSIPGIITGSVLGIGRAAGETAPILFTAGVWWGAGIPETPFDAIQALPIHLLELTKLIGYKSVEQNAWATALLLLSIVLGMNAIGIIIREKFRVEF